MIHQRGKMGSLTLEWSIRSSNPDIAVERHHFLLPGYIKQVETFLQTEDASGENADSLRFQIEASRRCFDYLQSNKDRMDLTVVSAYRDPLDLAIAGFFQNITTLIPAIGLTEDSLKTDLRLVEETFTDLFHNRERYRYAKHYRHRIGAFILRGILAWFDEDFLPTHGLDVFGCKKDENGWISMQTGSVRYVIYRFETLPFKIKDLVLSIPGTENFVQSNQNISSDKPYNKLYKAFRSVFCPSQEMADYYYDNRFFRFFYPNGKPNYLPRR